VRFEVGDGVAYDGGDADGLGVGDPVDVRDLQVVVTGQMGVGARFVTVLR